jgi:hypothetical protein
VRFSLTHNTYLDDGNIGGDVAWFVEKNCPRGQEVEEIKEIKELKDEQEICKISVLEPATGLF